MSAWKPLPAPTRPACVPYRGHCRFKATQGKMSWSPLVSKPGSGRTRSPGAAGAPQEGPQPGPTWVRGGRCPCPLPQFTHCTSHQVPGTGAPHSPSLSGVDSTSPHFAREVTGAKLRSPGLEWWQQKNMTPWLGSTRKAWGPGQFWRGSPQVA